MENMEITDSNRGQMKVYAARAYKDRKWRKDNYVKVNLPEYLPSAPADDKYDKLVIPEKYVLNVNYPRCAGEIKLNHWRKFPIMGGTRAPVRFHKGAEFLLIYPTGKIDEGVLVFLRDNPDGDDSVDETKED